MVAAGWMEAEMAYYEERRIDLRRGSFPAYRRYVHETLWPALEAAGARPLCLLNGLIGMGSEETYLFTGFPDLDAWARTQQTIAGRSEWIAEERARLLVDSGVRPKDVTPVADRRAVYGMRRFWIQPPDWLAFVRNSAEGIWPRIEAQDARILGLFRDAATTEPLECVLLTGYHGPAHWGETRNHGDSSPSLSEQLREGSRRGGADRGAMTLRSYVCLMTAHWL